LRRLSSFRLPPFHFYINFRFVSPLPFLLLFANFFSSFFFPFFFFPAISYKFLICPSCWPTTQAPVLVFPFTSVWYADTTSPLSISVLLIVSLFYPSSVLPPPPTPAISHIIMFLLPPGSAPGNFIMEKRWTAPFTPSYFFFCFVVFLFTTIWTDFYLFVLFSAFVFSFLFQYFPALYSTTGFWCLLALHVLFRPCSSAGLRKVTHLIVFLLYLSIY